MVWTRFGVAPSLKVGGLHTANCSAAYCLIHPVAKTMLIVLHVQFDPLASLVSKHNSGS